MKKRTVAAVTAAVVMMMPVAQASAQPDRDAFSVAMLVTAVTPDDDPRTTPNEKWVFFEDKLVSAAGVASIGATEYDTAVLESTLWGKLSPDGTMGTEWGEFTLALGDDELECSGTFKVKRHVATSGPVAYGESGPFTADCDDGTKVKGEFVGEFGELDGQAGFLVTMEGTAR